MSKEKRVIKRDKPKMNSNELIDCINFETEFYPSTNVKFRGKVRVTGRLILGFDDIVPLDQVDMQKKRTAFEIMKKMYAIITDESTEKLMHELDEGGKIK